MTVLRGSRTIDGRWPVNRSLGGGAVKLCRCSGGLRQSSGHGRGGSHVICVSSPATTLDEPDEEALLFGFGSLTSLLVTTLIEMIVPPGATTLTVSVTVTELPAGMSPRLHEKDPVPPTGGVVQAPPGPRDGDDSIETKRVPSGVEPESVTFVAVSGPLFVTTKT